MSKFGIEYEHCLFWYDRETLEVQTAIIEERYEDKIAILQTHLKNFYSQELKVRSSCKS